MSYCEEDFYPDAWNDAWWDEHENDWIECAVCGHQNAHYGEECSFCGRTACEDCVEDIYDGRMCLICTKPYHDAYKRLRFIDDHLPDTPELHDAIYEVDELLEKEGHGFLDIEYATDEQKAMVAKLEQAAKTYGISDKLPEIETAS